MTVARFLLVCADRTANAIVSELPDQDRGVEATETETERRARRRERVEFKVALRMHSSPLADETSTVYIGNSDVKLTTGDEMRDRILGRA